jgi:hypothetical protein
VGVLVGVGVGVAVGVGVGVAVGVTLPGPMMLTSVRLLNMFTVLPWPT